MTFIPQATPYYSLVIEWDNPLFGNEGVQQERMLAAVAEQMRDEPRPGELIFLYDSLKVDGQALDDLIRRWIAQPSVRLIPTAGKRYYSQKNEGTRHSRGELVFFLDSDVVPEPGWLTRIVGAFDDSEVDVVAGMTYVEPVDPYARCMGMIWIFPARSPDGPRYRDRRFWANNVAFRREVALRFPFPERSDHYRGKLAPMTHAMAKAGVRVWRDPQARTMHPPPERKDFVERAIQHGRDRFITHHRERKRLPRAAACLAALRSIAASGANAQRRITQEWQASGLQKSEVALARRLGFAYHACMAWGALRGAAATASPRPAPTPRPLPAPATPVTDDR